MDSQFSGATRPRSVPLPPVLLALCLAGACGGDGDAVPEPTVTVTVTETAPGKRVTSAPDTDTPAQEGAKPDEQRGFPPVIDGPTTDADSIRSPTGNIHCVLYHRFAECLVREREYGVPPEDPNCRFDWTAFFWVHTEEAGYGQCRSDSIDQAETTLAYGTTSVVGRMACQSQESGMYCWDTHGGHGFRAARASYDVH